MKIIRLSLILLVGAFAFACDTDDPTPEAKILNHDSDNLSSPNLSAGTWEAGASFTSSETSEYLGDKIQEINYYIYNKPDSAWISIYQGGTSSPGTLVYTAEVTSAINAFGWNTHTPTSDITVSDGMWVTFGYTIGSTKQVIGCDPGPAAVGGDRLKSGSGGSWSTFEAMYPGNSINWNIRTIIAN